MDNVIRIRYLEDLNQLWLIGSDYLKLWLRGSERPVVSEIIEQISDYVEGVESASGAGVVLGACFTNLNRFYTKSDGSNLLVFPLHNENVSYVFRDDVDYLINNMGDPKIICPRDGIYFNRSDVMLFFAENPFENKKKYEEMRNCVLQSPEDIRCFYYNYTRKRLVRRAARAGLGSLEPFVENTGWE